jgi:signal transduction histidine kinase
VQLASIASNRLEELIRRISGFVHLLIAAEVTVNGFIQVYQKSAFGMGLLSVYLLAATGALVSLWFGKGKLWPIIYSGTVLLVVILTPFASDGEAVLEGNARPWIWWAIGFSVILFAVFTTTSQWVLHLILASGAWFYVELSLFGEARLLQASLDSAFFIVYCLAVMALVSLVRQGATEVDLANGEAIQSSLQQARIEAIERERQRVDALVHDQVLHTLLLAARAQTKEEKAAAKDSARQAIASLKKAQSDQEKSETVTTAGLFRAIENAAVKLDTRIQVQTKGSSTDLLPPDVAQAMTEATLQALDNAIQHSEAKTIELLLASNESGVEFRVTDDGIGFRPERVSKDRIGISTSIHLRLKSIQGVANVVSSPGKGTVVTLRWPND